MFGVYNSKKPDKIRGVFDSFVKFQGVSLNSVLLSEPKFVNDLTGILLRLRKDAVGTMADIEQMFYRFLVTEDHRDFRVPYEGPCVWKHTILSCSIGLKQ